MCKYKDKDYHKKYYLKNKKYFQEKQQQKILNTREKYMLAALKTRCKLLSIPFNLTLEDVLIPKKCPLLGVNITNKAGRFKYNPSFDRINPKKGYIKGNVQIISDLANRMKQDASKKDLLAFAKGILDRYTKA